MPGQHPTAYLLAMKEKIRHRLAQALLVMAYAGIALVYLLVLYGIASLIV